MGWHGPRGTCGCCQVLCSCPGGGDGYASSTLDPYIQVELSLASSLSEIIHITDGINGLYRRYTMTVYDLDSLNGTHLFALSKLSGEDCIAYTAATPTFISETLNVDRDLVNRSTSTCSIVSTSSDPTTTNLSIQVAPATYGSGGNNSFEITINFGFPFFTARAKNVLSCRTGFVQADEPANYTVYPFPFTSGGTGFTHDGSDGNVYGRWPIAETWCSLSPTVDDTPFILGTMNSTLVWL